MPESPFLRKLSKEQARHCGFWKRVFSSVLEIEIEKGRLADGSALPMGAMVYAEDGTNIGMVGQGGQAYARVAARKATLRVQWGDAADSQCGLPYALQDDAVSRPIIRLEAECAPLLKP
jgi:outer membrane usher protein